VRLVAFRAIHHALGICPVMRHMPVWINLFSVFGGECYGRVRQVIERTMTLEANIFAAGWLCGGVRL